MSSDLIPVTVLTGFLGSGKTTILSHLVRNSAFADTAVIVNEFGEVGLDHALLEAPDESIIDLSCGCICCTMGTELLYALSDALDRRPRPDYLVIEASGVACP